MNRPIHGGNLAWAANLASCPISSLLDFSASINPLGPPKSAIAAIQDHLSALSVYPDPNYTQLRTTLSQWHQIPPEWILPGNGAAELLTWASRELAQQKVTYVITPAFNDYWRALKTFAAKVKTYPLSLNQGEWQLNSLANIPESKSTGLLLNNPHNPTGKLLNRAEILPYLDTFGLVVIDEAFMDFLPPQKEQSLIEKVIHYPNLVIVRSLTKFYSLPGLRLGYVISHPDRLKIWQQWRDPWPVNALAAALGEAVIQDRSFQEKTWAWLSPTREHLFQGLAAIPRLKPFSGAANFLLVETQFSSSQLQEKLLKNHYILIRDCLSFSELGDRYFRIAVRTQSDNQLLLTNLSSCTKY